MTKNLVAAMTDEEKIAGAAEIIVASAKTRGEHISLHDATVTAKKLYDFWRGSVHALNLKPGDIAQHHRERYHERDDSHAIRSDATQPPA